MRGGRPEGRPPWYLKSKSYNFYICARIRHYFPKRQGRLPEGGLVGPCHGSSTPVRISHSRPPCVIPRSRGAGTGRKYPPAEVMARQPTTGCFSDGWNRWAPYLAVIYTESSPVQVVLAHPPPSLGPFGPLPGTCSGSGMEFSRGRPRGKRTTPSLFSPSS